MKFLQYHNPSKTLILLSILILGLGIAMTYLVHNTVEDLWQDAEIINEAGMIRGSIQRVTKLVLSDARQSPEEIIKDINRLINRFIAMEQEGGHSEKEEHLFEAIHRLKENWLVLEYSLAQYKKTHSRKYKRDLIAESEACWQSALGVVHKAQLVTEEKVRVIRNLFYLILFLNSIVAILVIMLIYLYVRKKLEYESSHDALTRLYNRRTYDSEIESELARSQRYRSPLSLILFDIDFFKKINDKYGHNTGDKVLVSIAKLVEGSIRETDSVYRVGGEEFAVIIPETRVEVGRKLAEKLRSKIENYPFEIGTKVTISLGLAGFHPGITKDQLYKNADKALYRAKNGGRNRVEVYTRDE